LDLSWDILQRDEYKNLRACLFASHTEMMRFRQLIVNGTYCRTRSHWYLNQYTSSLEKLDIYLIMILSSFTTVVLATDIFDKELNDLRKKRWQQAFSEEEEEEDEGKEQSVDSDLRATIVIEHIIQASDVSHTMQHWHVYRKWNKCLFKELYQAYKEGRMGKNPAEFWYQGELGFFDNYVIPLAKKLKECGVFGVSSDEYLNYALANREEWAERGQEVVAGLIAECQLEEEKEERKKARALEKQQKQQEEAELAA
jgi:hypothetical protein